VFARIAGESAFDGHQLAGLCGPGLATKLSRAALVVAAVAVNEGRENWRGEGCCSTC
jgi:hypothetical protein